MLEDHDFAQLVVIGSSAGGIEALSSLVATLTENFPAPILIAQHLDPHRPSHLAEILGRRTELPVRTVEEEEALEPGVIFVVPANRHVELTDHEVRLPGDGAPGPMPSIDRLFSSAAQQFGEGLIAIILTGTGSDGAAGARYVKDAGGTVIIQNPETARFPTMPLSLAPTTVDIVADVENIGGILYDLLTGAYTPSQSSEDRALRAFLDHLRERSGIDFTTYKAPTISRRLQRRMVATSTEQLSEYTRYLEHHPEEYLRLVNSFLIKVTEFFRDGDLFTYLRDHTMPALVEEARQRGNEVRIWSAGCATGEEAYSLAILLSEVLGDELARFNVRIFATDLDDDAVSFARRGIYPASALAGLPPDLVGRYFAETDGEYEVKKPVRNLIIFGQHDLGQRAPFPRMDLVLCRNVLIYFTTELQRRALQLFAFSLRNGGALVLGKAETTGPLPEYFAVEHAQLKVFRRQGERVELIPPARIADVPVLTARASVTRRAAPTTSLPRLDRELRAAAAERPENVLLRLPVGLVSVDRHYDIRAINATARDLLQIHSSAIGEDLIHLSPPSVALELRTAIDTALRTGMPADVEEVATTEIESGETRYLSITCHPNAADTDRGPIDSTTVVVVDITPTVQRRLQVEIEHGRAQAESARLREQFTQLAAAHQRLLEANQQLTAENAELRSANEEFLVGNEEMQAATEEVETLNEELQATNEELETLNEELQATVEELNTTNDDLQARSHELTIEVAAREEQRLAAEAERSRLIAILASMADAVLVVDAHGQPILTNAVYDQIFGGGNTGLDLEDDEGARLPPEATPQQRAARGEAFIMQFARVDAGSHRWFEAAGRPIHSEVTDQGGVVVIRDITDRSVRRLQEEFVAMATHELRTPLAAAQAYVELLVRDLEREPEHDGRRQHLAAQALSSVQRLAAQVSDLMDVGRVQSSRIMLRPERVELQPLVERTVEVVRTLAQAQTIRFEAAAEPLVVQGEPRRLEQTLLNLLTNAMTYAPNTEFIDVRLGRAGAQVEIQVQDYGPGISLEDQTNLFSQFYQVQRSSRASRAGLGLGLYIAREIVTAHGGTIEVTSRPGEGATFIVRLPLAT